MNVKQPRVFYEQHFTGLGTCKVFCSLRDFRTHFKPRSGSCKVFMDVHVAICKGDEQSPCITLTLTYTKDSWGIRGSYRIPHAMRKGVVATPEVWAAVASEIKAHARRWMADMYECLPPVDIGEKEAFNAPVYRRISAFSRNPRPLLHGQPDRPEGYRKVNGQYTPIPNGPSGWLNRLRCAWGVFTGRADALFWYKDSNWPNVNPDPSYPRPPAPCNPPPRKP